MVIKVKCTYYNIDFEKVKNALLKAIYNIGNKGVWPPRRGTNSAIYSPYLSEDILKILRRMDTEKLLNIRSPTLVWKLYLTCITGMRLKNWVKTKREELAKRLLNVSFCLKEDDFYYEKETNRLKNFKIRIEGEKIKEKDARYLKSLMWMHQEALYYNFHNIGLEVHGPYTHENRQYVVYDYSNFNPPWKKSMLDLEHVRIISEFEEVDFKIDSMGNYYGKNLTRALNTYVIGMEVPVKKIEESLKNMVKETLSFTPEQLFEREKEIVWFSIKPWKELIKEDWKPPNIEYDSKKATSFKIKDLKQFIDVRKSVNLKEKDY